MGLCVKEKAEGDWYWERLSRFAAPEAGTTLLGHWRIGFPIPPSANEGLYCQKPTALLDSIFPPFPLTIFFLPRTDASRAGG